MKNKTKKSIDLSITEIYQKQNYEVIEYSFVILKRNIGQTDTYYQN